MKVQKIDIWMGEIRDETGGLASAIAPLVAAGVDFSFVIGTRRAEKPVQGPSISADCAVPSNRRRRISPALSNPRTRTVCASWHGISRGSCTG